MAKIKKIIKQKAIKEAKSKMKPKTKVLIAMSGGVDSSVAAFLLKQQGYEVIGVFMKNYTNEDVDLENCNWVQDRKEAMKIASLLEIPLITLDFEKEYRKLVVNEMFNLYKQGITPNPDVDCNNKIKFPLLWRAAKKLGCDLIATGHYARINRKRIGKNYQYRLFRAKDETKDQSYFLYRLNQKDLSHTIFPIGNLTKAKVREIAKAHCFPNWQRKGTVGICFIGKVNLKRFLQKRIKAKQGKILDPEGNVIGEHDGIYYYTIGQKIGPKFGIDIQKSSDDKKQLKRWYVAKKDVKKNVIVAAPEGHKILLRKEIKIRKPHWISNSKSPQGNYDARIRQVGELLPCKLRYKKGSGYKVILNKAIKGISEGQAIVLYKPKSKETMGGGIIRF